MQEETVFSSARQSHSSSRAIHQQRIPGRSPAPLALQRDDDRNGGGNQQGQQGAHNGDHDGRGRIAAGVLVVLHAHAVAQAILANALAPLDLAVIVGRALLRRLALRLRGVGDQRVARTAYVFAGRTDTAVRALRTRTIGEVLPSGAGWLARIAGSGYLVSSGAGTMTPNNLGVGTTLGLVDTRSHFEVGHLTS